MPRHKNLRYLDPTTTMTLGEGIRELRAAEGADGDAIENVAPELSPDLDIHVAIHVLFACRTNLGGEIRAHLWTLFGTNLPIKEMHRVNMHQDHRQVLADIGHGKVIRMWLKNIPQLIATMYCSFRMSRRWPAADYAEFLHVPLVELRSKFNIHIPNPQSDTLPNDSAGAALRHVGKRRLAAR